MPATSSTLLTLKGCASSTMLGARISQKPPREATAVASPCLPSGGVLSSDHAPNQAKQGNPGKPGEGHTEGSDEFAGGPGGENNVARKRER
eukprot:15162723-Alexandrium_andersonii.AAC.1